MSGYLFFRNIAATGFCQVHSFIFVCTQKISYERTSADINYQ